MSEIKPCPFCGSSNTTLDYYEISCPQELGTIVVCNDCGASAKSIVDWNTRPIEDALNARIVQLEAELAALKSENVSLSKKVTDYGKELRQSYKYDKTCSTCRYLDENRDCVLGIRCVNYTLWQGKIL